MKNLTKGIAAVGALAMLTGVGACGSNTADDKGQVYFLNNKPEVVNQWNELAEMYTKQTGVKVDIQSATSGSYESTLSSELAKNNAPTMFGIGGFDQYAKYKDYLEPLQDTEAYKLLNDQGKQMAHKDGDNVYGLPYAAEWFGIIVNKKLINEYAKKDYAVIKSFDDIKDYNTLKKVADSMQQHKDDLGIDGAFSTPGLDSSNYYRYASHMTQVPVAYEYIDEGVDFEKELKGTYLDNYKNLWDLEMKDNPTENTMLGSVNYEDSTAEFSAGKVAFYPNGVWAYSQIKGNEVADEDLAMLPYYMGFPNESKYATKIHRSTSSGSRDSSQLPICPPTNIPQNSRTAASQSTCPPVAYETTPEMEVGTIASVDVAAALRCDRPSQTSAGTITVPPPMPNMPDSTPTNMPTTISTMMLRADPSSAVSPARDSIFCDSVRTASA